jgi:hypothetical protein
VTTPSLARDPVVWSDVVDSVLDGDLVAAAAYVTPAGGAVVACVAPCGYRDRSSGRVGYTTSLGLPRKVERIIADPHVALLFHTRQHGLASSPHLVLVQGLADVDLAPSRSRLEAFIPLAERHLGRVRRGRWWDWILREYYGERVFVDISVSRITVWPEPRGAGRPEVAGAEPAPPPLPQAPPGGGVAPRVPVRRLARRCARLPHQMVAYRGADGYPVIVPVRVAGYSREGLRLDAPPGLLPPGGRRAGLLAHRFRPKLVGLHTRFGTGWLDVDENRAVYMPHTARVLYAPPLKTLLLVSNGLLAKRGMRRARRTRLIERLVELAAERSDGSGAGGRPPA